MKEKELPKRKWRVAYRTNSVVPFGYEVHPDDDTILLPIPEQLEALEEARKFEGVYTYRSIAKWLESQTGRYISHNGLMWRLKKEKERDNGIATLKSVIAKLEKAKSKLTEYEEKFPYEWDTGELNT